MALQSWSTAMEQYLGLDVSLKLTAICIVDRTGKIEREGVVPSDPEAIATFIKSHAPHAVRIMLISEKGDQFSNSRRAFFGFFGKKNGTSGYLRGFLLRFYFVRHARDRDHERWIWTVMV
jgi:hypothetical protein